MAWKLKKTFTFEAAHQLPHHDGKCARLHGHSWRATITLHSWQLETDGPKRGMVTDYADLKREMQPLLDDYLDHHFLNETLELENPTSEEIARWIFWKLKPRLSELTSVTVRETCTCQCTYTQGTEAEIGVEAYTQNEVVLEVK